MGSLYPCAGFLDVGRRKWELDIIPWDEGHGQCSTDPLILQSFDPSILQSFNPSRV
jgi:hypothetical protein